LDKILTLTSLLFYINSSYTSYNKLEDSTSERERNFLFIIGCFDKNNIAVAEKNPCLCSSPIQPEINRDWTQIGGARETQWTTVAVLRACSELTLFARFFLKALMRMPLGQIKTVNKLVDSK
jgi:hypothetical protein